MVRAKVDVVRRGRLHTLLQHPETMAMIDHFTLAEWIEICDKLNDHVRGALGLSLEVRQVLYSARQMLMPAS